MIRGDSKRPASWGLVGDIWLCCPGSPLPAHAGCGAAGSQAETSRQWQCQTCAMRQTHAQALLGMWPLGLVLPPAEVVLLPSLYPSFGATCAPRLGAQSWAQLLRGALHPLTPLATSCPASRGWGKGPAQPSRGWGKRGHPARARWFPFRLHLTPLVRGCSLSPLESIGREGRGTGLAAQPWRGAGGTSELLIGSILALSFAVQATSPQCLWGPVRCEGEGAPSSSDPDKPHPPLPPPPPTASLWVRLCGQIDMI